MIEIHIFGATSRLGNALIESLGEVSVRKDGVYKGYLEDCHLPVSNGRKKVLVVLAWSGYPSSQSEHSEEANKSIVGRAQELACTENYDQIIFSSSAGALYRENSPTLQTEADETRQDTPYGKQKLDAEISFRKFCNERGVALAILRITTAYGFSSHVKSQGVITRWIDGVIKGKEVELWINRRSAINFISYDQVADAIQRVIMGSFSGLLNIGCRETVEISSVLDTIEDEAREVGLPMIIKRYSNKARIMCVDCTKSVEVLGKSYESAILDEIKSIFREMWERKTSS